jgi:hypothetical protein
MSPGEQRVIFREEQVPGESGALVSLQPGDYVAVRVESTYGQTLTAKPLQRTNLLAFAALQEASKTGVKTPVLGGRESGRLAYTS